MPTMFDLAAQHRGGLGMIGVVDEFGDVASDDVFARQTQRGGPCSVAVGDGLIEIGGEDDVVGLFEDQPIAFLAVAQPQFGARADQRLVQAAGRRFGQRRFRAASICAG